MRPQPIVRMLASRSHVDTLLCNFFGALEEVPQHIPKLNLTLALRIILIHLPGPAVFHAIGFADSGKDLGPPAYKFSCLDGVGDMRHPRQLAGAQAAPRLGPEVSICGSGLYASLTAIV